MAPHLEKGALHMPRFDAVILDFDGTFANTSEGVLDSANFAFRALGYPELSFEGILPYLGPPLEESMRRYAGMTREQAKKAIAIYRKAYAGGNCFRMRVYDGMEDLLQNCRAAGVKTAVASAKPTVFLEKILARLGMRGLFNALCGTELSRTDPDKSDLIASAMKACGAAPERTLMVGDRRFDMEGARKVGAYAAGVLYGFGTKEELLQAGAQSLAKDCAALERLIFGA
jgi:phosphoglycolate phosphatase